VVTAIRATVPGYRVEDFLATFRFSREAAALFLDAAKRIGFD
jgi:hypothetical protein